MINGTRRTDHNCHGVALDVFMQFATRFRWKECRDFWPDDYVRPLIDTVKVDYSYLSEYAFSTMNQDDFVYSNKTRSKWATRHSKAHCEGRCDWPTNDPPLSFNDPIPRECGKCGRVQRWDREIEEWLNAW